MRPSAVLSPVTMPSFFSMYSTMDSAPQSMHEMFVHTETLWRPTGRSSNME